MDDGQTSQYAIQIAVHTLRDRCKSLQQHIVLLEEENVNLRIKCSRHEESQHSLNEIDYLRAQVAELSEQKEQSQNKVKLVMNENQELWSKLSKLTRVNKTLGSQLTKINDKLTQHTNASTTPTPQSNLIRSKTFTKSELQTKVLQKNLEENDKISLELEDISLKLSDSFSKQKKELDQLCSEISEMTFANELGTENYGFLYDEELESDMFNNIQAFADDLKILKETVLHQQTVLELSVKNIQQLSDRPHCKSCKSKRAKLEKGTSTIDLNTKTYESKYTETDNTERSKPISSPSKKKHSSADHAQASDRICPLCSKVFQKDIDFVIFQKHVEDHFVPDISGFEML